MRNAENVGIHDNARGDAIGSAQHYVGCLSRHTRQGQHFLHGSRDLAAKIGHQFLGRANDVLGLVAEKARGADFLFQNRLR